MALPVAAVVIGAALHFKQPQVSVPVADARAVFEAQHGTPRSPHWPAVRAKHLAEEPACVVCGSRKGLQVHHILSFRTHPELELVDANLITLCGPEAHDCHLVFGHLFSWMRDNPDVRLDAAQMVEKIKKAQALVEAGK